MSQSTIAQRMAQNHKRFMKPAKLHLVSLMDIFTILVFFLLLNSGDNEMLKNTKQVKLPDSVAQKRPESTITVTVTTTDIIVEGRPVATMDDVINSNGVIPGLQNELKYLASKRTELTEEEKVNGRPLPFWGTIQFLTKYSSGSWSPAQNPIIATCPWRSHVWRMPGDRGHTG